jgi:hypothetical protein
LTVVADPNDRRLTNQDQYLLRAALTWRRYRARSETWEHDHCALCGAKFMDPELSEAHRQHIAEHPDVFTEGYTTTAEHEQGAEYHWICKPCFEILSTGSSGGSSNLVSAVRGTFPNTGPGDLPLAGTAR